MARRDPNLRAFVKYDRQGDIIPSTLILRTKRPPGNGWVEIAANFCCTSTTTTTTTTEEA